MINLKGIWTKTVQNITKDSTLQWAWRVALLAMAIKLTFFSNKVVQTQYLDPNPTAAQDAVIDYKIILINKQDSTFQILKNEKINHVHNLPHDSLRSYITNNINQPATR